VGARTVVTAALAAGLFAAAFEMLFVLPIQWFVLHTSPVVVFQSIAYAAIGKAAFAGGLATAGLGVCFHVLISVVAAGLYALAATRWPLLLRRPWLMGMAYGMPVYLVMSFVVLPLSKVGFSLPKDPVLWFVSFSIHFIGFSLPIALVCRQVMGPARST
jgi:uncharacterized membrane protein YagU involved in acid resistance